ncbi:Uncharacterised protein [Bordetella pertussis]|nr:Uncharacterised protein [Bordetella pertussis]CPL31378.1 Uncharacterised protein [Bordetella pertussis]
MAARAPAYSKVIRRSGVALMTWVSRPISLYDLTE